MDLYGIYFSLTHKLKNKTQHIKQGHSDMQAHVWHASDAPLEAASVPWNLC